MIRDLLILTVSNIPLMIMKWQKSRYGCLFLICLWLTLSTCVGAERPNVVLVLIDDLSHYGVTPYGANQISLRGKSPYLTFQTPRIDRLASEGLRCDHAYAYPLCEPTPGHLYMVQWQQPFHRSVPGASVRIQQGIQTLCPTRKLSGRSLF